MAKQRRVSLSPGELFQGRVQFSAANAHYIERVLRLKPGERIIVFDGSTEHLIALDRCRRGEVSGHVLGSTGRAAHEEFDLALAFACIRPGPLEEILRHGTELGVSRFIPVLTRRCTRRPGERKERWESVVASAAAQSGRVRVPVVEEPIDLDELLLRQDVPAHRILLSVCPGSAALPDVLEAWPAAGRTMLVGPEGGLEAAEAARALAAGFIAASLGPRTLRTETAALVAVGVAMMWRGRVKARSTAASDCAVPLAGEDPRGRPDSATAACPQNARVGDD